MLTKLLATTAAFSILTCGGAALAAQAKSSAVVGPKEPIPYTQLQADPKATHKTKARKSGSAPAASAATGMPTDTSATSPAMPADADPSAGMPPATASAPDTAANPAPSTAPPSLPRTPPTNAPMTEDKMTQPSVAGAPPMTPPTEPK